MSRSPANNAPFRLIDYVDFGENVIVFPSTNPSGCRIGDNSCIKFASERCAEIR